MPRASRIFTTAVWLPSGRARSQIVFELTFPATTVSRSESQSVFLVNASVFFEDTDRGLAAFRHDSDVGFEGGNRMSFLKEADCAVPRQYSHWNEVAAPWPLSPFLMLARQHFHPQKSRSLYASPRRCSPSRHPRRILSRPYQRDDGRCQQFHIVVQHAGDFYESARDHSELPRYVPVSGLRTGRAISRKRQNALASSI
jgi:hypothetical protein